MMITEKTSRGPVARRGKRPSRRLSRLERMEAEAILAEPMFYMDDDLFHEPDAEKRLFRDAPPLPTPNCDWYHPAMEQLQDRRKLSAKTSPLLTARQERTIFLQFNYARFKVAQIQEELHDEAVLDAAHARLLLRWHEQVEHLREQIVRFNLALVLAMAKHVSSANLDYMELISEGNMALLRSIDKFDVSRGFKFSTYACRAILKSYSRLGVRQNRHRGLFPVEFDPEMEQPDPSQGPADHETAEYVTEMKQMLATNAAALTEVEQEVIRRRFQLDEDTSDKPMTLTEVGKLIGYTKERVRQIQNRALAKMRATLEDRLGEGPFEQGSGN